MANVQQWGRNESLIWPPRRYLYSLGALFLAVVATGFFVFLRLQYGLPPLERYYLRYYLRTEVKGILHPSAAYQLLYIAGGKSKRPALDSDVQPGLTPQAQGKALPLVLSEKARKEGAHFLFRETPRRYSNKALHAWIAYWIYGGRPVWRLFTFQLALGLLVFLIELPVAVPKDIRRLKDLRYGRRLKGPFLVSAKGFNEAVSGDGIGITTDDAKRALRIPRNAENKHFLIVGDTGSGKSSIIRQMLYQVEKRGECAIVYDPACEFVKQFYNPHRGDIVLNPLDARMPYWSPSLELRRRA